MSWQPIETAPRDEDVYILAMRAGALVPFVASYDADFDNWYTYNGALENNGMKFAPTHWMPLPEAPDEGSTVDARVGSADRLGSANAAHDGCPVHHRAVDNS